jgi:two-component system sensor histidine kinase DesK
MHPIRAEEAAMYDADPIGRPAPARGSRFVYFAPLVWLIWLPYIAQPIISLLGSHPSPLRLIASLAGAAVFVALYVWAAWQSARSLLGATLTYPAPTTLALWLPILVMFILSYAETTANGFTWGALFIYTCAAAGGRLPTRQALGVLGVVVLIVVFGGVRGQLATTQAVGAIFTLLLAGGTTIIMVWAITTSRQVREVREAMGRFTAVAEERLRIARDLHDLLGHNLSLIALKSELAGRLLHAAPERAATEIADIESVARTALQEVRDTVASYRRPALASELRGAREILAAAGIAYRFVGDEEAASALPAGVEGVLSWAVREGVTNVIRHSRARTCIIHLTRSAGQARVEILDDGPGAAVQAPPVTDLPLPPDRGNGLRGLAERVRAADGIFEAGPREEGGFRLAVSLPLASDRDQRHASGTPVTAAPVAADTSHAPAEEALP